MGQQRGLTPDRRVHVGAKKPQVGQRRVFNIGDAHEGVHPRAPALVFPREEVDVERCDRNAVWIPDLITLDLGIPGHRIAFDDLHLVERLRGREEAIEHALEWKVRPELFFVEVVFRLALFLRIVCRVPRLHLRRGFAFELAPERPELGVLALERGLRLVSQVLEEGLSLGAILCHAIFGDEVGEIPVTEELCLDSPKLENSRD